MDQNLSKEQRLNLHQELIEVSGTEHVFFQPPETLKLVYPCIIYKLNTGDTQFADDNPYTFHRQFNVMYITKDPDSDVPRRIAMHFPMSRMDRFYTADNLNHYIFMIYY